MVVGQRVFLGLKVAARFRPGFRWFRIDSQRGTGNGFKAGVLEPVFLFFQFAESGR